MNDNFSSFLYLNQHTRSQQSQTCEIMLEILNRMRLLLVTTQRTSYLIAPNNAIELLLSRNFYQSRLLRCQIQQQPPYHYLPSEEFRSKLPTLPSGLLIWLLIPSLLTDHKELINSHIHVSGLLQTLHRCQGLH